MKDILRSPAMKKIWILVILLVCVVPNVSFAKTEVRHYPDGKIQSVVHFNRKHIKNGSYKVYWTNGRLMEQGVYKNGKIVGIPQRWSIEGIRIE
jgi:antitoxin component YwqK of YwqJK toxin-antitoxin module